MKLIDRYILKKFFGTFLVLMLLFVPIGITVDIAEKIDNILRNNAKLEVVLAYYMDFTVHFANLLFPLFVFLSVIWFTSKMANNTEVIAILSSGVSYNRFLKPYFIGIGILATVSLLMGMYLVPNASRGYNDFVYKYVSSTSPTNGQNIYRQINPNEIIYVNNFNPETKIGTYFTLEHFKENRLLFRIEATNIQYNQADSLFRLTGYTKRIIGGKGKDRIEDKRRLDTILPFDIGDLAPVSYVAETLSYNELTSFIDKEESRGSSFIDRYKVVKYKKWSVPVTLFILGIIGVAVSSAKRRGGMGVNLTFGMAVAMIYVFFDKIFGVLADQSNFDPLLAVWTPNIFFGFLALYLINYARR